jgi:hypothetical protein
VGDKFDDLLLSEGVAHWIGRSKNCPQARISWGSFCECDVNGLGMIPDGLFWVSVFDIDA